MKAEDYSVVHLDIMAKGLVALTQTFSAPQQQHILNYKKNPYFLLRKLLLHRLACKLHLLKSPENTLL
jgi:hypothetical protein